MNLLIRINQGIGPSLHQQLYRITTDELAPTMTDWMFGSIDYYTVDDEKQHRDTNLMTVRYLTSKKKLQIARHMNAS